MQLAQAKLKLYILATRVQDTDAVGPGKAQDTAEEQLHAQGDVQG